MKSFSSAWLWFLAHGWQGRYWWSVLSSPMERCAGEHFTAGSPGVDLGALLCGTCQFLWWSCSHRGWFHATTVTSLNACPGGDAHCSLNEQAGVGLSIARIPWIDLCSDFGRLQHVYLSADENVYNVFLLKFRDETDLNNIHLNIFERLIILLFKKKKKIA